MARVQTALGEFARRGFSSPAAAARAWGRWQEREEPPVGLEDFEPAADRDQALEALSRISEQQAAMVQEIAAEAQWLQRLILVLGASQALAKFLQRHPKEALSLRREPSPVGAAGWRDFFAARLQSSDGVALGSADALRQANQAALLQIAARDLEARKPEEIVEEISRELSYVADAVLDAALSYARAEVPGWERVRLAILAMGKTGAQELNYVSDVDVIFVAEPADGVEASEAMQLGARLAAALSRVCSANTVEGTIWPVDAALRPEGKAGPLVRSLDSCAAYYQKWAKNWEFQALLKARPAAGDLELGKQFCDLVEPLVWAAGQRPNFVPEVRAMRNRVISLLPPKHQEREIKLGPGGLRDTEFSVQLLQLVHGRADERLRLRGTFDGLRALVDNGYIGRSDGAEMAQAYAYQRVLEHRCQLRTLRRTHLMPTVDEPAMGQLSRQLGKSSDEVWRAWRLSARQVQRLQQRLFFSPLLEAVSAIPTSGLRLSAEAAHTRLEALGFTDPRSALGHIKALTAGTTRSVEIQRQLMPAMLGWFAEGPNPDFGMLAFRQLSDALGSTSWYLRALRDEGYMAQRFAKIASTSRYVVDLLKRAPNMVRMLAEDEELRLRDANELRQAMERAIARASDKERAIASVRALRRSELCRIALSDVLGRCEPETVSRCLSNLAAATLDAGLALARREVDAPPVGVIAMGSWGGWEMSYASDADAMFVVPDESDAKAQQAATQLVRRACDIIGKPGPDPALVVDSDLRPEGKGGPQVRTVSSYTNYYRKWADTWEAQALLRGRPGAGDQELAAQVLQDADWFRYPAAGLTTDQVNEIRRLKARMESERIPRGVPKGRHLKLGEGGLSDVEWSVQLLQLQHAAANPQLRSTQTMTSLTALKEAGLVTATQASYLGKAWRRSTRLRSAIMLVRGRSSDALPTDSRELSAIAELLGYPSGQSSQLLDDTIRMRRRAARIVARLFWGE